MSSRPVGGRLVREAVVPTLSNRGMQVVLLGTGTPNADPERSGPAIGIVADGRAYLIDFGPGVVRRAAAACAAGMDALAPPRLECAFLTHLHSDHTAGYPDLILSPWVLGREHPLRVFGPPGLSRMTERVLDAYREGVRERIDGLEPANRTGHDVEPTEVEPGVVYDDGRMCVEAFAVNHGLWPAFGYRFTTTDRVVVISGDTAPFDGWEETYAGCDLLVHEVQSVKGLACRDPAWRAYHTAVHTTTADLAAVASIVNPRRLVLVHVLFHGVSEEDLLREMGDRYDGDVALGRDLDIY